MVADTRSSIPPRIIVALDYAAQESAETLVKVLDPRHCRLKVGFELFTAAGPPLVKKLVAQGFDVFLDLKYHDIPNTVAKACRAAAELGVWMINVHALGGRRMLEAAAQAVATSGRRPLLIAVTVLTSHAPEELVEIGLESDVDAQVLRLASLAKDAGLDGVVCSGREAPVLRSALGADWTLVTPGIRPATGSQDDQRRAVTPGAAIAGGADYLVVGRPVTGAADPAAALAAIRWEIGED